MNARRSFRRLSVGVEFRYDGDVFVKTDESTAWELRGGRLYKEWAFMPGDIVEVLAT